MRLKLLANMAAVLTLLSCAALGQSNNQNTMNSQDRQFASMAAQANRGEVELATLAQQHASNHEVKQFAKLMIGDHTAAAKDLKAWASKSNFNLPSGISADDSSTKSSLSSLSGSQFDQKYIQGQLEDHKKVISAFESEIQQGQDPQLKKFAEEKLPVLQDHIRVAEDVAGQIGLSGKAGLTVPSKAISSMRKPSPY